ncbi:xanthine dehydrogenase family protein subunit M [Thermomicrobium sp. 4228-Ro]|uniref:FAD binding domain-containing protein n=1 Tax=Thermomicrobium sp. 4228-Ro TaxID=2993937 RepID=UPI002248A157|nr:xanthine dehydrogenase family protein subunit M [Thermomicrobium sp. 4228-Ro]MCX2726291.1 xanthine dehydrogenase family protein subunit M [Thermomicrobium sp. 4228-Ro]
MKPPRFRYTAPESLEEALALLADLGDEAKPLAGGQSLVPMLNMRLARPSVLVDLNRIAELDGIELENGFLRVKAMTRHRAVERSPSVAQYQPLLAEAIRYVGHLPIRTRGTVGGSIAHADPAAELPGVLVALDGAVELRSRNGQRVVPAGEFFVDLLTTVAAADELVTAVRFPVLPTRSGTAWLEVARRHGDYALVGIGAVVTLSDDGRTIEDARLSFIGVSGTPVRARSAEAALRGQPLAPETWRAAAAAVREELDPTSDIHASAAYRRFVAGVLAERALALAAQRALEGMNR